MFNKPSNILYKCWLYGCDLETDHQGSWCQRGAHRFYYKVSLWKRRHGILDSLFKCEEINGGGRCPTYLYRWILLKTKIGNMYLHHFVADDWSLDLHDHPKRFTSIGLKGFYYEDTPDGKTTLYKAPWIRSFPATHIHRLRVPSKSCWTLVFVGSATREWGFWHQENIVGDFNTRWRLFCGKAHRFINWKEYVRGQDKEIADKMKACD